MLSRAGGVCRAHSTQAENTRVEQRLHQRRTEKPRPSFAFKADAKRLFQRRPYRFQRRRIARRPRLAPAHRGHETPTTKPNPSARLAAPDAPAPGTDILPSLRRPPRQSTRASPTVARTPPHLQPVETFRAWPVAPPHPRPPTRSRAYWSPAPADSGPNSGLT